MTELPLVCVEAQGNSNADKFEHTTTNTYKQQFTIVQQYKNENNTNVKTNYKEKENSEENTKHKQTNKSTE